MLMLTRIFRDGCYVLIGLTIIFWIVIIVGCATFSLKAPTTQMLIRTATFAAGYEIGKANPALAVEIMGHTEVDRKDILTFYLSWKNYLAYRLEDPIQRRLVATMLNLVSVDLQVKSDADREEIIRNLFREFIAGLQEGINAHN